MEDAVALMVEGDLLRSFQPKTLDGAVLGIPLISCVCPAVVKVRGGDKAELTMKSGAVILVIRVEVEACPERTVSI